jgi:hypothetical protein
MRNAKLCWTLFHLFFWSWLYGSVIWLCQSSFVTIGKGFYVLVDDEKQIENYQGLQPFFLSALVMMFDPSMMVKWSWHHLLVWMMTISLCLMMGMVLASFLICVVLLVCLDV